MSLFDSLSKLPLPTSSTNFLSLSVLGFYLFAIYAAYVVLNGIFTTFLRPGKKLTRYGSWACVTGATDGIGKAMAIELAKQGLNIILVSRSATKLTEVASEIREKVKKDIEVKTLAIDFSAFDIPAQHRVKALFAQHDVGVLINNVGMSYSFPNYFGELDSTTVQQLIDLNVQSTTIMTHIALPFMVERKRGSIVCISSAASLLTNPLLAQYSAAKSYVDAFARALDAEYSGKGIRVQVQNPLFVTTKLAKIRASSLTVPTPSSYAKCAVRAIGYETQTSPYWAHKLQIYIMSFVPDFIIKSQVLGMHLGLRKRAMKKLEKESQESKAE